MKKNAFYISILLFIFSACSCEERHMTSLLDVGFEKSEEEVKKIPSPEKLVDKLLSSQSGTHHGLDISHFQGNLMEVINPRDSIKFIICKATQGTTFLDPDFRMNWREIREKGFIRGVYHFYDCNADPIAQANFFSNQIRDIDQRDIPPILDIEQGSMTKNISSIQMETDILRFLQQVERNVDRRPLVYTNYEFAQQNFSNSQLIKYQLWLAEYNKQPKPLMPDLWKEKGFLIWQRSANYDAYSRQMDLDVMFGNLKDIVK